MPSTGVSSRVGSSGGRGTGVAEEGDRSACCIERGEKAGGRRCQAAVSPVLPGEDFHHGCLAFSGAWAEIGREGEDEEALEPSRRST
jgi:hypothetical protein